MSRRKKIQPVEKHHYSPQEIVYSSGWVTAEFRLADKQRQLERDLRKKQESVALGTLYDIIETENIVSLSYFVRFLYSHYPELVVLYKANHQLVRDYINSRRFDISCGFVEMPYNEVCKLLKSSELYVSELENKICDLYNVIDIDKKNLKSNELLIAQLRQSIEEQQSFIQSLIVKNHELSHLLDFENVPL